MARSRNIKPALFKNEHLAMLPFEARLLFIGLWTLCDRAGKLEDRPLKIRAELFPFEPVDVDALLKQLQESKGNFIQRYSIADQPFIKVLNFEKHQNPHCKEPQSVIPDPISDESGTSTVQAPVLHHASPADSLNLIPDSLRGDDSKESSGGSGKQKFSEEAKQVVREFRGLLEAQGQKTFERDWYLTSYSSCQSLLNAGKTPDELRQAMAWAVTEWACRSTMTHFKHLGKALPHWEKTKPHQKPIDTMARDALLSFPFVIHRQTGEILPVEKLESRPESPGSLFYAGSAFPVAMLEGLQEVPA